MKFFSDQVIKDYVQQPGHPDISRQDQTQRFVNEVAAYRRLNDAKCPFVAELLEVSVEDRWFAVSAVKGASLFELLQKKHYRLSLRQLLRQIDQMNHWLRTDGFNDMKHNIKDLILDSSGKLFLVDFETYLPDISANQLDIYESIIYDLLERILIRESRKSQLTGQFLRFSIFVFLKRPVKTVYLMVVCLSNVFRKLWTSLVLF
tara:strand:+ start:990 stop:1601 length:612 start_codon:yes stop_codon:yes gene_type:complete